MPLKNYFLSAGVGVFQRYRPKGDTAQPVRTVCDSKWGTCTRLAIGKPQRAFMAAVNPNFRFQELRGEVVAEQCPHRGFQRSRPGRTSSAQLLRWHIGWKRSNKIDCIRFLGFSSGHAFKAYGLDARA
jgi:hypothetical protein